MASDGCQELGRGQMPIYGKQSCWINDSTNAPAYPSNGQPMSRPTSRGNTGTWYGSAPVGNSSILGIAHDPTPTPPPPRAKPGPRDVLLRSGSRIPYLAMGTEGVSKQEVEEGLKVGYTHIECSPEYSNQQEVGAALQSVARDQLFVTSHLRNDEHRCVEEACKATLKELNLQYLDLYLISWPVAWKKGTQEADTEWSMQQTWAAMEALVDAGLVRNIGMANFSLPEVETVLQACRIKPAVLQVELHPLNAQRKLVGVCKRLGCHLVAHHPLGGGKVDCMGAAKTAEVAKSCEHTHAQTLLQWNMGRCVGVVANMKQMQALEVDELFQAQNFCLTTDEKRVLDTMNTDQRCYEPQWAAFRPAEEGGVAKPSIVIGY